MRIFAAVSVTIAVVGALVTQGGYLGILVSAALTLLILLPFGAFLVIALLFAAAKHHDLSPFRSGFLAWLILFASVLIIFFGGSSFTWYRIHSARAYVDRAVVTLDSIKASTGLYPKHLPIDQLGSPPTLLSYSAGYDSDGSSFRFEYWDPGGLMDGYEFTSTDRKWSYFD
jgi:hypothetical protein